MTFEIQGRPIGPGHPVYIVAEMSANHNHDYTQAVRLVEVAAEAGVDAVKLQTYTPDTMTIASDLPHFQVGEGTLWQGRRLYDLYREAHTPWDWQPKLKKIADGLGLHLFSSPFDGTAVDFLESMGVPAHKVASFEIVDVPLIRRIARAGKPVIMSTGMATLEEIREAVEAVRGAGNPPLALLKCTSAYPAPPEEMNLLSIPRLAREFGVPVGLSDHTLGIHVALAGVALGACILEKHFTLSRRTAGPDSAFSLEPDELKELVRAVRTVEKSLGRAAFGPNEQEKRSLAFRRSLFVVKDMKAGETFTSENLRSIRPGNGLHPRHLPELLGRKAARGIPRGTPLDWDLVAR
jgi:pseudaminic acid synthase